MMFDQEEVAILGLCNDYMNIVRFNPLDLPNFTCKTLSFVYGKFKNVMEIEHYEKSYGGLDIDYTFCGACFAGNMKLIEYLFRTGQERLTQKGLSLGLMCAIFSDKRNILELYLPYLIIQNNLSLTACRYNKKECYKILFRHNRTLILDDIKYCIDTENYDIGMYLLKRTYKENREEAFVYAGIFRHFKFAEMIIGNFPISLSDCLLEMVKNKMMTGMAWDFVRPFIIQKYGTQSAKVLHIAIAEYAKNGMVAVMKYFGNMTMEEFINLAFLNSSLNGNVKMVEYLYQNYINGIPTECAISTSDETILDLIIFHGGNINFDAIAYDASLNCKVETLIYLIKIGIRITNAGDCHYIARENGYDLTRQLIALTP